ncbi:hypothetical protein [Leucothrix mucor]|uniref:hypothetical protein n=1 Tax=Leucothrix mucor TaxID=45248 RepID=UPI0003B33F7D|nr:hypothetical protein [Leucothrix mucor]
MTIAFIKQINEYVINATLEASDEAILASVGSDGYPSPQEVQQACAAITQTISQQRANRLSQEQSAFAEYKKNQKNIQNAQQRRSIPEMLSDIVSTMQKQNKAVPDGIILAFREQGKGDSEEDIIEIWQNLVELGLIDPNGIEK